MSRSQCLVVRNKRILMVQHVAGGMKYWCLPGGGIEQNETPAQAALRELAEECNVNGQIIRQTSEWADPCAGNSTYTFHVDIGGAEPTLGEDPDCKGIPVLIDVKWVELLQIPERDRVFLWAAGLLAIEGFIDEVSKWGDEISYPSNTRE